MPGNQLPTIQHIVHLMLENRSFDHMLGFLYEESGNVSPAGAAFEGLTGQEANPDSSGKSVSVYKIDPAGPGAYFMPGADPGEGYANTNSQLFGSGHAPVPPVATNQGFVTNFDATIAWDQRVGRSVQAGTTAADIMGIFPPAALPVLSGLARGFAVCDHWFSSVPTQTFPNRAFACAATSQGHMNDGSSSYTVPSIFGLMGAHGLSWKIYGYDAEPLTRKNFPDTTNAPDTHFGKFSDFKADAANGQLPQYSFLEPDWGSKGNSQHPNYDVALGEQLMHDVYYALRGGPGWNQTLLFITYDEHGGCYDHVPPPSGAVPPDDTPGEFAFDFTRFGVRIPAVLVSPLIPAGTVFRVAAGSMPLDHTSVLKTIETRWGLPALTRRDAAAPDVGDALTLETPRSDDPLADVTVPVSSGANPAVAEVSHIQQIDAELTASLPVPNEDLRSAPLLQEQHTPADYDDYTSARTAIWKAARSPGPVPRA
ncbi:MAG TPA: alkaline phosphatase family protein [Streptosporangiaceae bacterium]|nr:alkaline phosphatase family protein [Streptosporangiaceae bacterium]